MLRDNTADLHVLGHSVYRRNGIPRLDDNSNDFDDGGKPDVSTIDLVPISSSEQT